MCVPVYQCVPGKAIYHKKGAVATQTDLVF